jgi:hypothetical protein
MRIRPTAPLAALSFVVLSACATPLPAPSTPPAPGTPPPSAAMPPAGEDTCGAATYAPKLGDDYRTVPPAPAGRDFRVVCTTCPTTKDYSAQRLNFFYDQATGEVVRLTCG